MKLLSIGEIAKKVDVASHTIRFWTEEFPEYIQFETGKGDRRYYPEESIVVFHRIKDLIHSEGIKIRIIKEKKLLLNSPNQSLQAVESLLSEALQCLNQI